MNDAMKPVWLILFVVAGLLAVVGIARMNNAGTGGDGKGAIPWKADLADARDQAAAENKPVLLYFTADWCGPCQKMKKSTWVDSGVAGLVGTKYVPVMIDVDAQPDVAREFGVQGIPRVEIVQPAGGRTLVTEGYMAPGEMLSALR